MDAQSLLSAAERDYLSGRYVEARAKLIQVEAVVTTHPAIPHLRAVVERRLGNSEDARLAFQRALRLAPNDHQIANNHANLLSDLGQQETALAEYLRAAKLAPAFVEAHVNAAITFHQLGRFEEANRSFDRAAALEPANPAILSARGALEQDMGNLAEAGRYFDRALAAKPDLARAIKGRARVARARGEPEAASLYARASALDPADRRLAIEEAEIGAAEGDSNPTGRLVEIARSQPDWAEGHDALARIRWELGDSDGFDSEYRKALEASPKNAPLWAAYIRLLADSLEFERAADTAVLARRHLGDLPAFILSEASYAGFAGDIERAERLFRALPPDTTDRAIPEARHRIRRKEYDRAEELLAGVRAAEPANVLAWALTEVLWRTTRDPRSEWLSKQPGFLAQQQLPLTRSDLDMLAELLRGLHNLRARPLGQSLREGTQTRHRLFDREDAPLSKLRDVLAAAVQLYLDGLPSADPSHPLLSHKAAHLQFAGSWSVRLTSSGHHVSHIHPAGILSSACYIAIPQLAGDKQEGWLELGAAPPDLGLDLEPLGLIEPQAGRLALFPSYLFHGTRPFGSGERLTVAFDMALAKT